MGKDFVTGGTGAFLGQETGGGAQVTAAHKGVDLMDERGDVAA
ncbi:hypothetical protein [Streptomyces sp. 3214.6]|nr:hypothetical protein [Streptomyces sp. 3214.6]